VKPIELYFAYMCVCVCVRACVCYFRLVSWWTTYNNCAFSWRKCSKRWAENR